MFENYLINPAAIAHVANTVKIFELPQFQKLRFKPGFLRTVPTPGLFLIPHSRFRRPMAGRSRWRKLLSGLFTELSETRCTYRKIEHGLQLTAFSSSIHLELR
jgi:hypothetical protein